MTGVRDAIKFVQDDIDRILAEREGIESRLQETFERVGQLQERISNIDNKIQSMQGLIAQWRDAYGADIARVSTEDADADVVLQKLKNEPYWKARDYFADQNAGLVVLQDAYDAMRAAGFSPGFETAFRTALVAGKNTGNWKRIGRGRWQRLQKTNGHNGRNLQSGGKVHLSLGPMAFCRKCHINVPIKDPYRALAKNGRNMHKGVCYECGTRLAVFGKADEQLATT